MDLFILFSYKKTMINSKKRTWRKYDEHISYFRNQIENISGYFLAVQIEWTKKHEEKESSKNWQKIVNRISGF